MTESTIPAGGPDSPDSLHLVQLLLPLYRNDGAPVDGALFRAVRDELTERFGGLTAYTRAPAEGLWKEEGDGTAHDQIVVHEVMVGELDAAWWHDYRRELERRFGQEALVVRAHALVVL